MDAREPSPANWISHAHGDHAQAAHGLVFGTPRTLRFYRMRVDCAGPAIPIAHRGTVESHGARLTSLPAVHILGSAQLLVEFGGERLLYSSDIKLRERSAGA